MRKIAIATDAHPMTKLGGPGRFAPSLFINLKRNETTHDKVIGLFADAIANSPEDIIYDTPNMDPRAKVTSALSLVPHIHAALRVSKRNLFAASRARKLQDLGIHVLHAHDFNVVSKLSKFSGKIIFTNHFKGSMYEEALKYQPGMGHRAWKSFFVAMERMVVKRADVLTFPSESAKKLLEEDYPDLTEEIESKAQIIYSGIDPRAIESASECINSRGNLYLNVANHIPDKGIEIALSVFREIKQIDPDAHFINVGLEGPETDKMKATTEKAGLSNSVEFCGVLPHRDVIGLMKSAFALLHTPKRVVFDLTMLEAMAAGLPVIATDVLGNREALGGMHPLYISSMREVQKSDVQALGRVLYSMEARQEINRQQFDRFSRLFTMSAMVERYIELYEQF